MNGDNYRSKYTITLACIVLGMVGIIGLLDARYAAMEMKREKMLDDKLRHLNDKLHQELVIQEFIESLTANTHVE